MGRFLLFSSNQPNPRRRHSQRAVVAAAWISVCLLTLGTAASAADGIEVLASDAQHVRLSSGDLQARWVPRPIDGQAESYFDLEIPGYTNVGEPGGPRTPRQGAWLLVPPGTRPVLKTVSEQWETAGGRRLMVEAVPVILPGQDDGSRFVSQVVVPYGQPLPEGVDVPQDIKARFLKSRGETRGQALTLGEVTWWRGRRLVSVQLVPVLHDGQGHASRVLASGTWDVVFVPEEKGALLSSPGPLRTTAKGDDHFGSIFLNAELLNTTLPEGAYAAVAPQRPIGPGATKRRGTLLFPESQLVVKSTRLQRVTAARLRERGLLPTTPVPEADIRLFQRRYVGTTGQGSVIEIEVPLLMVGDGGNFEGSDYFVFYGLRLRDDGPYTADLGDGPVDIPGCGDPHEMNNDGNIYWLAAAEPPEGQTWARMSHIIDVPQAEGTPLTGFRVTQHFEENLAFRENVPDIQADRIYQNKFDEQEASVSLTPLWPVDTNDKSAKLTVDFAGFSSANHPSLAIDLYADNALVTNLAEGIYVGDMGDQTRTYTIPGSMLAGNNVKVTATGSNFFFLNWVEAEYDALYQATGNGLDFNIPAGSGQSPLEITGFSDGDVGLIDITDPRNPVAVDLKAANVRQDGETFTLTVNLDQGTSPHQFTAKGAWHGEGIGEFSYISSRLVADPVDPSELTGPEPDLLVVTHHDFKDAIGRWIDHRIARSQGNLTVKLVDVQDLYDHYSGGLHDDWAIKRFTAEAIARWGSWSLMLVGDANENARELKVTATGRAWATDFVPAHYHVQNALSYNPELMATDKWYATSEAGMHYPDDNFPAGIRSPWEMYVGRFPCNSVDELNTMIDKVIQVESPQPGQTWRRRGIFFADDAWSNGYYIQNNDLVYRSNEEVFTSSTRDSLATAWRGGSPVTLAADTLFLGHWLDPLEPQGHSSPRDLTVFQHNAADYALQPLLQSLTQGGLVCFYQGHANQYVLCSEYWIEDMPVSTERKDVAAMNNAQAPWFFFGMGCHISDWAQNTVGIGTSSKERSLSEKMMIRTGGGASGTYGSSGYEYISANQIFGEKIFRRWMFHPPVFDGLGGGNMQALPGRALSPRSRWIIGELMWASEADVQAILGGDSTYREMLSQYTLLGDPLMVLDAGEPQVEAAFQDEPGTPLSGEVDLQDRDGSNQRTLDITARDEAGIDRLRFYDSRGNELTADHVTETLPTGQTDQQEVHYTVDVPIRPFAHTMTLDVFDTGAPLPTDRHWQLNLKVAMDAVILAEGQPLDPGTFTFTPEVPVDFFLTITSGAALSEGATYGLGSANLDLTGVVIHRQGPHELTVQFTATARGEVQEMLHSVYLDITESGGGTSRTDFVLQNGASGPGDVALGRVMNYPNPMVDETRFVIETDIGGKGVIRVFSVAGRVVASISIDLPADEKSGIVTWDGRDNRGDELANGTYLYRVEMEGTGGRIASGMHRLVVMR